MGSMVGRQQGFIYPAPTGPITMRKHPIRRLSFPDSVAGLVDLLRVRLWLEKPVPLPGNGEAGQGHT
jgi:hypothetical protein